ncbi:MAG: hypothetical protein R8F63_07350 [Acidimicrobiales bacterium]|nr:hypothetical protein [Acidimicrobiales bacterium]
MSIEKGQDWGSPGVIPDDAVVAATDHEASEIVAAARRRNDPLPPVVLTGGDLARTLGGASPRRAGDEATLVPVDLGAALIDGKLHWFLAHLVARHGWWRGRIVVAANAAFLGSWNVAPRAHPGDGLLDVLDGELSLRDRLRARRRLPTGTHVPHPAISVRRRDAFQLEFRRPTPIRLDGELVGNATKLSLRIEPAAVEVWI